MHMLLRFSTVISGKERMPRRHTRDKKVPLCVSYDGRQQFKPKKGKSFHIFRHSPKPMPAVVTNIKIEWVLVQLGCPQMYS